MSSKQQILEIIRTSVETIKVTDSQISKTHDVEQHSAKFRKIVDPDEINEAEKTFARLPAFTIRDTIPCDVSISQHTNRRADFLTSLKLPDHLLSGEYTITFFYQNKNLDSFQQLFKLKMKPGQEYQLKDPLPILLIPFTKIWFTGSDQLIITYINIIYGKLRKNVTDSEIKKSTLSSTNVTMFDNWEFLPDDCGKYFTYYGALFPVQMPPQQDKHPCFDYKSLVEKPS